jgi:hypothetical protein
MTPQIPEAQDLDGLFLQQGYLTSADIDPEGSERTTSYFKAEALAKSGDLEAAMEILQLLCATPHIYHGHYRLLFQHLRAVNKEEIKAGNYETIRDRVLSMVEMDDQMIQAMLSYWSGVQRRKLGPHYFDGYRKLKISDAKALLVAATELGDRKSVTLANRLVRKFEITRDKAKQAKSQPPGSAT